MQKGDRCNVPTIESQTRSKKYSNEATNNRRHADSAAWSRKQDARQRCDDFSDDLGRAECAESLPFDDIILDDRRDTLQKIVSGPNQPHPALEYSPFYHAMKRFFPLCLERFKIPYVYRWKLAYPLQRKVSCSRLLLKLGIHLTWGEMLLLVPYFLAICIGIFYTVAHPSVAVTGRVARWALIAAFLLAQRNSIVTFLLGMPVDRALYYHKLAGRLGGITGLLHTLAFFIDPKYRSIHNDDFLQGAFTGQMNASGSYMMLVIVGIIMTSLPAIRRAAFEVFYYLHMLFVAGLILGAFFHTGILVPTLALVTWGVDFTIRKLVMAWTLNPQHATLKVISDTVVEVSFPKTESFAYNPGQYIYLAIPEITWLEWHPFSISSAPHQTVVTLHIRKAGNWTASLFELAQKKQDVEILLEGPYGSVAVDIMGDRKYKSVLLISGGIGITPMQSICDQLLFEKASGHRELRNLKFVWIERDPVLVQQVSFLKNKQDENSNKRDSSTNSALYGQTSESIVSTLMSLLPPGDTSDADLEEQYADGGLPIDDSSLVIHDDNHEVSTCSRRPPQWIIFDNPDHTPNPMPKKDAVLDLQVYLTGNAKPTGPVPFARLGRPDINALFDEMRRDALTSGDKKVAVCVSAPHKLMSLCHRACVLYSDDKVRFDYHCEAMAI